MEDLVELFGDQFSGRRVLLTGHTGFKGSWLGLWLRMLGAEVSGFSLDPPSDPNLYTIIGDSLANETIADIRDRQRVISTIAEFAPELIFHLAAQPIVRESYRTPLETLDVNVTGTANVLEGVRLMGKPCAVVVVTSDKCYRNEESGRSYCESDALGGHDVYSMSKAAAELVTAAWRSSFFSDPTAGVRIASVRGGNVIGGGDFAAGRIVPDCMRALIAGEPIGVRNPQAIRPWQHVLDCLGGYLTVAGRLLTVPDDAATGAFNFGPSLDCQRPVSQLVDEVLGYWPGFAQTAGDPGAVHEAGCLSINIDKAAAVLDWHPVWNFSTTVEQTVSWYRDVDWYTAGQGAAYCEQQVRGYCHDALAAQATLA